MSATKSVTALLAGIAIDRGDIESLETTLGEVLVEADEGSAKGSITLRNLLKMRAGIAYSNDDFSLDMEWGRITNSVRYVLHKRLAHEPGTVFDYTDACAHLCGALVQRATSRTLHVLAKSTIFDAAGIRRSRWLAHSDERSFGAYGLFLTPRDFLRLGHETLRSYQTTSGSVPLEWVRQCTSPQVEHDFDNSFDYGYYWWLAPDGSGFTPEGHGGQVSFVDPELELVVTITADPNSSYDGVAVELDDVLSLVRQIRDGARG
jgi:CubicO group peptidase (beta-lactamase class C family)